MSKESKFLYKDLSEKVIGAFYAVYDELGYGILEKVYELALIKELEIRGILTKSQVKTGIKYKGEFLCDFQLDMVVEDKIVLELKALESLGRVHTAQLLNYLKA
ncbi:MAG: GxxExxY protein, partial [Candidatus Marinimicrobia bacterium]|nr:GxxExxY protein [Candidatus Neomarinimicrobiota bacterium]